MICSSSVALLSVAVVTSAVTVDLFCFDMVSLRGLSPLLAPKAPGQSFCQLQAHLLVVQQVLQLLAERRHVAQWAFEGDERFAKLQRFFQLRNLAAYAVWPEIIDGLELQADCEPRLGLCSVPRAQTWPG